MEETKGFLWMSSLSLVLKEGKSFQQIDRYINSPVLSINFSVIPQKFKGFSVNYALMCVRKQWHAYIQDLRGY